MSVPPEEWRPIRSAPGYQASSLGRIRRTRSGRVQTGSISGNGYLYTAGRTIHSLVCEAFHGRRPEGAEVRHLDGNRLNNAAENLRWGTPSENRHDSVRHGTHWMVRRAS